MIRLTRINGKAFVLNADRVLYLEETPDTIITLDTKERVIVKDSVDDVIGRIIEYHRTIRSFTAMEG